jgi:putative redox protein
MLTCATWQKDMEFKVDFPLGESLTLTSIPDEKRPGPGPSPVEAIQAAVASCTGIDVVLILGKMRKTLESLSIEVDSTRRDEEPRIYTDMELIYHLAGPDLDAASVLRAVKLSHEKYCSVSAMLEPTVKLSYKVELNGEWIDQAS